MQLLFDSINEKQEKQENTQTEIIELPEAFQVCTTVKSTGLNGKPVSREEIIDTFMVDKVNGIVPIEKAKNKAKALKRVFPEKTYYVIGIYKRIEATY